jgi:hypothetical protein
MDTLKALITENPGRGPRTGLRHHYPAGLAVDSGDPQTIIVSASQSAREAYSIESAESLVYYRRCIEDVEDNDNNNNNNNNNSEAWKPDFQTYLDLRQHFI